MRLTRLLLAAASAVALTAASLVAAGAHAAEPGWTHQRSDLRPDPRVRFGVLPNGMKYAIMPNKTPPGEAAVRLRFDAGSLDETDAQRGLAHFLEHMAFNGSKRVPEGEMVKILERVGLAFGPDTNAYTGLTETVYMLDLPETDAKTLDTGLFLMRELAGELTLAPDAIDRERGVVLSEERTRDTPAYRVYKDRLGFLLKGQRPPERMPIGSAEVLRTAPASEFAEFYRRNYRPDQATLVVVGDVDPAAIEQLIRAKFGDWKADGPPPADPDLGAVADRREWETRLLVEPGSGLNLQLSWVSPPDKDPDTRAKRMSDTVEALGFAVLNRRFERLARSADAPFIGAGASRSNVDDAAEITSVAVSAEPDRWRRALQAVEQEQRRLVQHGVLQAELDREIDEYRGTLRARVAGAATRRSNQLAGEIVSSVDEDYVVTDPATELEVFEAAVRGLKAESVTAAIRAAFTGEGPLVFMATPKPVEGEEATLAAAVAESRQLAVAPPTAEVLKPWPYANWGAPGKVVEEREITDLDAVFVRFENGVRLTVKPTKLKDDEVLVSVRIGDGQLDLPTDRETVAWAAGFAVADGGTTDLTNEEIDRILAGKVLGASFSIDDEAFVFSGRTRPEDFATQLQLLTALTAKPGFRPEPFERMRSFGGTLHEQYEATPNGVLQRDLNQLLRGGDPRWSFPSREEIAAARPENLKTLLAGPLAQGPIEVVIVGDVTLERAIEETARTFGALPARPAAVQPPSDSRQVRFPAPVAQPVARTHKGRADQAVAYFAWPTTDFFADPQRARELRLLESVMDLRLTAELREKQGATYSPFTGFASSLTYPGYGYIAAGMETPPGGLPAFFADVRKIAASLRTEPVTADELERARKPRIEAIQRSRATNEYWLGQLSGAQTDPRRLDAVRAAISGLERVTPADIQRIARQYLTDDKAWSLAVTPAGTGSAAAASVPAGSAQP